MKIEKVKLMIGKTVNLGNYESARVDVGGEILLAPNDAVKNAYVELAIICREELKGQLKKINA